MKMPTFLGKFLQPSGHEQISASPPPLYGKFHQQLLAENTLIAQAAKDVKDSLISARLSEALAICDEMLALHPGHPLFEGLRLEAESKEREWRLQYIQQVYAELKNIPDPESRITHSKQALSRYPAESQLVELVRNETARREFIETQIAHARDSEAKGRFADALERWYTIGECHPVMPGLQHEIRRTEQLLQQEADAARCAAFVRDISRMLSAEEYERAVNQCRIALAEFPHDGDLLALFKAAQEKALKAAEIQTLIKDGLTYLDDQNIDAALRTFRIADNLYPGREQIRQLIGVALLEKSKSILNENWRAAQMLLESATESCPGHPELGTVSSRIEDRVRDESVQRCAGNVQHLVEVGDLRQALDEVETLLKSYPGEPRLLAESRRLRGELGEPVPDEASPPEEMHSPTDTNILSSAEPPAVGDVAPFPIEDREKEPSLSRGSRIQLILARVGIAVRAAWLRARMLGQEVVRQGRRSISVVNTLFPEEYAVSYKHVFVGLLVLVVIGTVWFTYAPGRNRPSPKGIVANPGLTAVDIAAAPDGAEVFIDGKKLGNSAVHTALAPGSYTILVVSPGYESKSEALTLGKEPKTLDVKLRPVALDLHIVTDQFASRAWLDEEPKGNLGATGITVSGVSPGTHTLKVRSPRGEVTAAFAFQPGQLPVPVSLPSAASPAILFVGTSNAKSRLECNCAPALFSVDGSDQSLQKGGLEIDLPEGEHDAELSVMGGKKLLIQSSAVPVATVGLYWGERPSAPPPPSVDVLLREANTMIGNRQYQAALAKVRQMLAADPNDDRAPVILKRLERLMAIDP